MIFVDEIGRVYQNWQSYLSENVLPKGTMVAPNLGVYTLDENGQVNLEICDTPASSVGRKVLGYADVTASVAGVASAACSLITLPILAPVAPAALAVGLTVAGFSTLRSSLNLFERYKHNQSISILDRTARKSWVGVSSGVVGLGASRLTRALTTTAAAVREVSAITQIMANGMNISSIVLSSGGIINGALDMFLITKYDEESISKLDILQLSASLLLFTHSVSNFRLASKIVNDTRNSSLQSYRSTLSNRQRHSFDKLTRETIRIKGEDKGKIDIIRGINEIPTKQYLNDIFKIKKTLNEHNIRPSFGGPGEGIVLNDDISVDTKVLRNNIQHNIDADELARMRTHPVPTQNNAAKIKQSNIPIRLLIGDGAITTITTTTNSKKLFAFGTIFLSNNVKVRLNDFGTQIFENIQNIDNFTDLITHMAETFCEQTFRFFMNLLRSFIKTILPEINRALNMYISTESVLHEMLQHCRQKFTNYTFEYLQNREKEILDAIKKYYLSLRTNNVKSRPKSCTICGGFFTTCDL